MTEYPFIDKPYAFTVCRIEPENNIHIILDAFSDSPPFALVMVGNWRYSDYGTNLRKTFESKPNIFLLDPIYDIQKLNSLRSNCVLYLHGHSCGGTNPSLVEAMYLGLPIAAYDINFNRETTENQALYFNSADNLNKICSEVNLDTLHNVASAMKAIAEKRYNWVRISNLYAKLL